MTTRRNTNPAPHVHNVRKAITDQGIDTKPLRISDSHRVVTITARDEQGAASLSRVHAALRIGDHVVTRVAPNVLRVTKPRPPKGKPATD